MRRCGREEELVRGEDVRDELLVRLLLVDVRRELVLRELFVLRALEARGFLFGVIVLFLVK